jgi:3-hydroxyacyl-CoA dehydrogenase
MSVGATTAIRRAAVLGAGTMGAQVAAHLANAGIPVRLLDVSATAAREGLMRARSAKPDPFFTADAIRLISTGDFDSGLPSLAGTDWIIEAIVERLDVKRDLLARIDAVASPHAIVSSNTSGIPVSALAEGRSEPFRQRFLGTHFFNPPRYLHLLELIPTPDTLPTVLEAIARFADRHLGKGVVVARDAPNFIANHLGLFGALRSIAALEDGFTIEEIDAMTGPAIGRPKSATFRTMDIAGIDVLASVIGNLAERLPDASARRAFAAPTLVSALVERGWLGAKAGQGFYKKAGDEILTLDPQAMAYRARQPARLPAIDAARSVEATPARLRRLFLGKDRVGQFLRDTLGAQLLYAARVAPDIAASIDDVDRAMRWGFGWELGPFETWDAIGVAEVVAALGAAGLPPLAAEALARGAFRPDASGAGALVTVPPSSPDFDILRTARTARGAIRSNAGCSLVDLGDDVVAVEFHSKMNAIGGDTIEMLEAAVRDAGSRWRAIVVGNEAANFSAGANLMLLLLESQEGNWDEVDLMVRGFQRATMALKYADVPVVVAPAGLALGGGCEICLHADRVVAAAETYMGLVETGVGLIPAGGGTKEMLLRAMSACGEKDDPLPHVRRVFETIGFARVSTSADDARHIGYLRAVDSVVANRDRLIAEAKRLALSRAADYVRPQPPAAIRVGGETVQAALKLGVYLAWRAGRISDHDALIGRTLASILSGGSLAYLGAVTEPQLLDLEREAFLRLCGERKTQDRIAHTLKTGKPLRN